jgi:cell division protease FtsH
MSAKLGAVKYGTGDDEPFLGRTYGHSPDYSIEVGSEIDGEVRALIEAAHTEAWAVLNEYRDVLDDLATKLLERETLDRKDLEVIFSSVIKRPRITTFDDWGQRTPSDRPPIKTPGELAIERGEPWPPASPPSLQKAPVPIGASAMRDQSGPGQPAPAYGQPYPYPGQPQGAPMGYPYPAPNPYASPQPGSTPPPNWTGGVLPGPLAPMPGSYNGGAPNGGAPNGGSANGWTGNGHGNGHPYANGHANGPGANGQGGNGQGGNGSAQPGGHRAPDAKDEPTDPWAPPGDQRR